MEIVQVVVSAKLAVGGRRTHLMVVLGLNEAYLYNGFFLGILNPFLELKPLKTNVLTVEPLSQHSSTSSPESRKAGVKNCPSRLNRGRIGSEEVSCLSVTSSTWKREGSSQ